MPQLRIPSHEPSTRSTDFASPAELLSKLSIFWFSLLSPKDQQDKIEQISNKLVAEDVDVGSLPAAAAAGETEEDVRRKAFAMLFNKAPVVTRVELFKEFTKKFFVERRLCEGILLSRQLGSNEQQEKIDEIKQSRYAEFYLGLSIIWFKARCASDPRNLIQVVFGKAGVDDHIFEKLVNETEEDFKLRRFTESFKQLQFISQEDIVEFIQDAVFRDLVDDVSDTSETREDESDTSETREDESDTSETSEDVSDTSETSEDVSNTFEVSDVDVPVVSGHGFEMREDVSNGEDVSNTGDSVAGITNRKRSSRKRFCAGDSVSGNVAGITSRKRFRDNAITVHEGARNVGIHNIGYAGFHNFGNATPSRPFWEPSLEFIKMSTPDLRGPRGATATQGGGQGAITQGGQGTSQQ